MKIAGDLGRISAAPVGGDVKVPAMKLLAVGSIGLLGTSTQASGGTLLSQVQGAVTKLIVKGDIVDADVQLDGGADAKLGALILGGSLVGTANGGSIISSAGGLGTVKIGGDMRSGSPTEFTGLETLGAIGTISVGGSIDGTASTIKISAFGQLVAPAAGLDLAIKSVTVGGSVNKLAIFAGIDFPGNADASIGAVTVKGDWQASIVLAGTSVGNDLRIGTQDDGKIGGRDNPAIFSSIGSITVKGQAFGAIRNGTS